MLLPKDTYDDPSIIFEFKIAGSLSALEQAVEGVLEKIKKKEYVEGVLAKGYKQIPLVYCIGFHQKPCFVKIYEKAA